MRIRVKCESTSGVPFQAVIDVPQDFYELPLAEQNRVVSTQVAETAGAPIDLSLWEAM
jgi:hypothetical protein